MKSLRLLATCSLGLLLTSGCNGGDGDQGRGIAVDAEHVYWCAQSAIWRVPLAGGKAVKLAQDQQNRWEIAVDGSFVYWTENVDSGAVRKVAK